MTEQLSFIDTDTELVKRDMTMAEMAYRHGTWAQEARWRAIVACKEHKYDLKYKARTGGLRMVITADDIRLLMAVVTDDSGLCRNNRMGVVFHCPEFQCTGFSWESRAAGRKGSMVRIWQLKENIL